MLGFMLAHLRESVIAAVTSGEQVVLKGQGLGFEV